MHGNEKTIKVGIAGAAFAAAFHFDSYRHLRGMGVEVVGVFSKNEKSRTEFARQRGLRAFDTFDEMARAVDVVDLCVRAPCMSRSVRAAELGRHVIGKPFAPVIRARKVGVATRPINRSY